MTRVASLLFTAIVGGCVGVHVKTPASAAPGAAVGPSPIRGASAGVVKRGGANAMHTERFCRSTMPRGWIAVDYVADSGCVGTRPTGDAHPVAIAVQYDGLQSGTELEVCSQERTPSDWYDAGWADPDTRCPLDGAGDDPSRRTVRRIRKH